MKVVKVRSPFIIQVPSQGGTHTGSKIVLTIWKAGQTEPTSGIGYYSLSKNNPSATQKLTSYNVSNYVKEFIENVKPNNYNLSSVQGEDVDEWCIFHVISYWYNGTSYTSLTNEYFFGVNGFSNYLDGNQNPSATK